MSIQASPAPRPSWLGEAMVASSAAPGFIAAASLGMGLALDRLAWPPEPGVVTYFVAWAAILSPLLVSVGTVTLMAGAVVTSVGRGPRRRKLSLLIAGMIAWGIACYWLSVPGLIDLP